MTPRERFRAMMNFQRPDKPFIWTFDIRKATMDEWLKQGYPAGVPPTELLGYDHFSGIPLEPSHWPKFERTVVEEKDGHITYYDEEGALRTDAVTAQGSGFVTRKWLKFPVESRKDFVKMKERYDPADPGRRMEGYDAALRESHTSPLPCTVTLYGFYWTMRQWLGFENLSIAFYDSPEFIDEMLDFILDFNVRLIRTHLPGAKLDMMTISEDMAYKTACMVSPAVVREKFVPRYRELVQEAKRVCTDRVIVDSDGHISQLIPLWEEAGIEGTSPVEIASEQDILEYAEKHPRFVFFGGIDKRKLARGRSDVEQEIAGKAKKLYRRGGWIPAVDHAVPADVPFENFKYMIELLKQCW
jgi:hypothetical protein